MLRSAQRGEKKSCCSLSKHCVTLQCPHGWSWPCWHDGGLVSHPCKVPPVVPMPLLANGWYSHQQWMAAVSPIIQAGGCIYSGKKGMPSKGREENVCSPTRCIQRPTTPRAIGDVHYHQVDHLPAFTDKGRCRLCPQGQTAICCTKCVCLCIITGKNPPNCFQRSIKNEI